MKKLIKQLSMVVMVIMMLGVLSGCDSKATKKQTIEISEFSIAIEGIENVTQFTNKEAEKLSFVELNTSVTNKKGEISENTYGGILLKDLLDAIGVEELTALTIEASDGYSATYDMSLAFGDDVIVGWLKNGELMENGQINILPAHGKGNQQVKDVSKLIIAR